MDRFAVIRSFVEVIDRGGFAAAGRALHLTGPMVGNHVRYLEEQLGGLLINRTTRAQSLTELGRAYLQRCRVILAELAAADAEAQDLLAEPRGKLCITAPYSIGSILLPPVIAAFVRENPAVHVEVRLDDGRVDLLTHGCDVAIRVGNLEDASLITRTLSPLDLVLCAAPSYLDKQGEPAGLDDLRAHSCLDFSSSSTPESWKFETGEGVRSVAISGPVRANSAFALRTAALEGLGIILVPGFLVRDDLKRRRLRRILTKAVPQSRPVQLLTLPDPSPTPKLRAFIDRLVHDLGPRQLRS